ncbi:MAG TPA: helix-turn-helix transcriptional regulator [Oligoflexia bacterium]|nr:helix-turn-helix transcriptional regulator [Oligoflexia bacterium]
MGRSRPQHGEGGIGPESPDRRVLHQIETVRKREGLSRRTVARRLGCEQAQVKLEEAPDYDLPLSRLYAYGDALGVPVSELLHDTERGLADSVRVRAQWIKVAKVVHSMAEQALDKKTRALVESLLAELVAIMPELAHVTPHHSVGRRRTKDELGRAGTMFEGFGTLD